MPFDVRFVVPLAPQGAARPRFSFAGGRAVAHKDRDALRHERAFAAIAARWRPLGKPFAEAVAVDVLAVMPRPLALARRSKRDGEPLRDPARRWHVAKPDADNIAKTVLDALRSWWIDDCIVAGLTVAKVVAALDEQPCYHVRIRDADSWMRAKRGGAT